MIITKNTPTTTLDIWSPRYKDKHEKPLAVPVALLAQYKVDGSAPHILVDFTKAKHLKGQRFYISRRDAQSCALDSNTKIPCYAVPMDKFEHWDTGAEVKAIAEGLFP